VCGGVDWKGDAGWESGPFWTLDLTGLEEGPAAAVLLPAWSKLTARPPAWFAGSAPVLMPLLCDVQGHCLVLGGYESGKAFDNFGDPVRFGRPDKLLQTAAVGIHPLLQRCWRSLDLESDTAAFAEQAGGEATQKKVACGLVNILQHTAPTYSALLFAASAVADEPELEACVLRMEGTSPNEVRPGCSVVLQGLQRRADLNGVQGVFVRFMPENKRCAVTLKLIGQAAGYGCTTVTSRQTETVSVSLANLRLPE